MNARCSISNALFLAVAALVLAASFRPASAVPVFARKYRTSCTTCHTVFPKLNSFGESFRLNGYRMPAETEDQIKEEPVSLGSEAYKKTWPAMVYPSTVPSNVPVAINVKLADVYQSTSDAGGRSILRNDFQFPQEVNLFTAGTLGEKFGFLGELTYAENSDGSSTTEIERVMLTINSPFGPEHAFNFKIGKFAPDYTDGFHEMWLMTDNGVDTLFTYNPIGIRGGTGLSEEGPGISLPENVKGLEAYGVVAHRFFYTLGLTNGYGPVPKTTGTDANSNRDFYARLDYKFGGMGLDGDTTGVTLPPENWREKSLRLGLLGYAGNGKDVSFLVDDGLGGAVPMEDRTYDRLGVYASWIYRDLNVFGVAVHGRDKLRTLDPESLVAVDETSRSYDSWFLQADYVIKPPFQASLRYEDLRPADAEAPRLRFGNADFTYLVRANIKLMLEYRQDLHDSKNYDLAAVLRFAM